MPLNSDKVQGGAFFNETLLHKNIIKKIGYPFREFFIGGDEREYYYRALRNGINCYTILESSFIHPAPKRAKVKLLWKTMEISMGPPWKLYYKTRNAINTAKLHFDTIGKIKVIIKYGL